MAYGLCGSRSRYVLNFWLVKKLVNNTALGPLLYGVSAGSPAPRLVQVSVCASILRLRTLPSRVRSRVFGNRGPVLRPPLGVVSGIVGRFGNPGGPTCGSWRSSVTATGSPFVFSLLSRRFRSPFPAIPRRPSGESR